MIFKVFMLVIVKESIFFAVLSSILFFLFNLFSGDQKINYFRYFLILFLLKMISEIIIKIIKNNKVKTRKYHDKII